MNNNESIGELLNDVGSLPTQPEDDMNKRIKERTVINHDNIKEVPLYSIGNDEVNIDWGEIQVDDNEDLPTEVINFEDDEIDEFNSEQITTKTGLSNVEEDYIVKTEEIPQRPKQVKSNTIKEVEETTKVIPFAKSGLVDKVGGITFEDEVQEVETSKSNNATDLHIIDIELEDEVEDHSTTIQPTESNVETEEVDNNLNTMDTPTDESKDLDKITIETLSPVSSEYVTAEEIFENIEESVKDEMSGLSALLSQVKVACTSGITNFKHEVKEASINQKVIDKYKEPTKNEQVAIKDTQDLDSSPTINLVDKPKSPLPTAKPVKNVTHTEETMTDIVEDIFTKTEVVTEDEKVEITNIVKEINETLQEFSVDEDAAGLGLSDITENLIAEHLNSRAVINEVNEVIEGVQQSSMSETSTQKKEIKANILDINKSLADIENKVKDSITYSIVARRIDKALIEALVETGKHYIEEQYTEIGLLAENVSMMQLTKKPGETSYIYFYEDIPEHLTGYRTPLTKFISELEHGIMDTVVKGKTLQIDLMDEENMYRLTKSELDTILNFIVNNKLSYRILNMRLYVSINVD